MTPAPSAARPVVLQARGLGKRFGATLALEGVDLALRAGEVHALMGQNGAGKSTLIKLLTGVERPDRGSVELDGRVIAPSTPMEAQREGIGTVYQEVNLCPNLSVAENLYAGRYPRRRRLRMADRLTLREKVGYGLGDAGGNVVIVLAMVPPRRLPSGVAWNGKPRSA